MVCSPELQPNNLFEACPSLLRLGLYEWCSFFALVKEVVSSNMSSAMSTRMALSNLQELKFRGSSFYHSFCAGFFALLQQTCPRLGVVELFHLSEIDSSCIAASSGVQDASSSLGIITPLSYPPSLTTLSIVPYSGYTSIPWFTWPQALALPSRLTSLTLKTEWNVLVLLSELRIPLKPFPNRFSTSMWKTFT